MVHHVGVLQEGGGHGQVAHSGGGNERVGQIKIVKGLQSVRLRKTRGAYSDGLVQTRILNFTRKFPNLGGGTSDQAGQEGLITLGNENCVDILSRAARK